MFIDKDSISITANNTTVKMGNYIVEAKYGYHKLWGKDSGRNLAGSQTGTLLGIFPKITMQFRALTKDELTTIAPILDSAYQTVTYYDATKNTTVSMDTYSNDWEVINKNIISNDVKNEGFSWAVISVKKRS